MLTDVHARAVRGRRRGRRRAADPGVPLPPDRPARGGRRDGEAGEREEGTVDAPRRRCAARCDKVRAVAALAPSVSVPSPSAARSSATATSSWTCAASLACARPPSAPVIFDATHSVQQPGRRGRGERRAREFIPPLIARRGRGGRRRTLPRDAPRSADAHAPTPPRMPLDQLDALVARAVARLGRRAGCGRCSTRRSPGASGSSVSTSTACSPTAAFTSATSADSASSSSATTSRTASASRCCATADIEVAIITGRVSESVRLRGPS